MLFRTLIFLIVIFFIFFLVQTNLIILAFLRIGIPHQYVFAALLVTIFGSFINIPVKKIPQETMTAERRVTFYGFTYRVAVPRRKDTVLAINVGGAIIPTLVSLYLVIKTGLYVKSFIATAFLAAVTFRLATPLPGIGIALPFFAPPLLAAVVSVILSYDYAPIIAYISGTVGTLFGADILNLKKINSLGAPVASIGGAGTFDGIFLNGIIAVILSAILT